MAATPGSSSKPISSSRFKYIFLDEWWVEKQRKGLAVGGITSNSMACRGGRAFFSSVIAKRHEPNVLETEDGITVIFRGFINASRTCQNGFPSQVCRHFSCGFPHDWKKYTAHSFGDEHINGITGFGDSNTCPHKRAGNDLTKTKDVLLSNDGVLNYCSTPKKICNGLGNSVGYVSRQSESTDNMEYDISKDNGENGVSDIAVERQAGNPENGQSLLGNYHHNPCTGLSIKGTGKSPHSSNKIRKDQLSSDCKEMQRIRQKDAGDSCSRMVTRSISKRSHTMLGKDRKVNSPVRRSPRLYNCRK